jgi:hypothetical protein
MLFLATRNGRTPFHASAIAQDDLAVLLVGPSGAGKSTLAFAAHAAGWTVLSEDTVYIQTEPHLSVRGWPGPVHLLPGHHATHEHPLRLRNGRLKHAVPLLPARAAGRPYRQVVVCLLEKGERVALDWLTSEDAISLMPPLEPGFDLLETEIRAAARRLVKGGAMRLTLSAEPNEAIACLAAEMGKINGFQRASRGSGP